MGVFLTTFLSLLIAVGASFLYTYLFDKVKKQICFYCKHIKEISSCCYCKFIRQIRFGYICAFNMILFVVFSLSHCYYYPSSYAESNIEESYQNGLNSLNNEIENYIRQRYSSEFEKAYKSENCLADFEESIRLKRNRSNIRNSRSYKVKVKSEDVCLKRDAWKQDRAYYFWQDDALAAVENSIAIIENELRAKPEIVAIYKLAEKDVNVLNLKKKISDLGKLREEELNEVARKREIWTMKNFILVHIGFAIFLFIILFMYNKLYTAREKSWRRKQNVENFIENIR